MIIPPAFSFITKIPTGTTNDGDESQITLVCTQVGSTELPAELLAGLLAAAGLMVACSAGVLGWWCAVIMIV